MPLVGVGVDPAGPRMTGDRFDAMTARDAGLVGCRSCARVWPMGTTICGRCGEKLQSRDPRSQSRVWAWWVAGVMAYIPANMLPMLSTRTLGSVSEDTIVGGAVTLAHHDALGVALVVLIASVAIPVAKFVLIAWLALSVNRVSRLSAERRTQIYEVVDYIGRWSMIDVFVVAILTALVQLSVIVSITPGPAAVSFAASVIFTMLAAQSFDSRLIWDGIERAADAGDGPAGAGRPARAADRDPAPDPAQDPEQEPAT